MIDTKPAKQRQVSAIILAGGEGRRAGGKDKGLLCLDGKPLIEHILDSLEAQVDEIIISANRNLDSYREYGHPVYADETEGYRGPLAGVASCLPHCRNKLVLVTPCDMPRLPPDLVALMQAGAPAQVKIAEHAGRMQLVMLVRKTQTAALRQSLADGELSIMRWVQSQQHEVVHFGDDYDFTNLNTGT